MNQKTQSLLLSVLLLWITACTAQSKNGFDLTGSLVPPSEILSGGPAKDSIPAIDNPRFVEAGRADFLSNDSRVLGMSYQGVAKAYPIDILNWHEIVNDRFGDEPVVITFCPLCGSGMAFSAMLDGKPHTFGVSGLLYNSDVLLYDRQTESLWSQLLSQAIAGHYIGRRLTDLPVLHTTWQDWRERHPDTMVLSVDTGFRRDYSRGPYETYLKSPQIMFPVSAVSKRYHPKEEVLGLSINGVAKVYPFVELEKGPATFDDTVGGKIVTIRYDRRHRSAEALDEQGERLSGVRTFWFAWYAFNPDTEIYTTPKTR
ncbi:MAG: hypothetical protein CVV06_00235 [Gammaproteobacteria bacterium HGW-Gammaproteobacteria-10]|nr:MAG: hypothetical protein CVV06_00235 [Gammaproteobacteria bacterium HGW-Gammaproteobacteria-10]